MGGGTKSKLVLCKSLETAGDGEWTRLVGEQKVHRLRRVDRGDSRMGQDKIGPTIRVVEEGGVDGLKDLGFGDSGPHHWRLDEGGTLEGG